jgi:hypothetical protein
VHAFLVMAAELDGAAASPGKLRNLAMGFVKSFTAAKKSDRVVIVSNIGETPSIAVTVAQVR